MRRNARTAGRITAHVGSLHGSLVLMIRLWALVAIQCLILAVLYGVVAGVINWRYDVALGLTHWQFVIIVFPTIGMLTYFTTLLDNKYKFPWRKVYLCSFGTVCGCAIAWIIFHFPSLAR